jgi:predicted outer membrane repeat protein
MVNVMYSTFSNGLKNSFIDVKGADLEMMNVTLKMTDGDSKGNGQGVKCRNCLSMLITNSTFEELGGYQGGAVYLKDSSNGCMEGNTFVSNSARQGGAIYTENSQLTIEYSTFLDNQAVSVNDIDIQNMLSFTTDMGAGGAIFFTCVDLSEELSSYVSTGAQGYKEPCAFDDKPCRR